MASSSESIMDLINFDFIDKKDIITLLKGVSKSLYFLSEERIALQEELKETKNRRDELGEQISLLRYQNKSLQIELKSLQDYVNTIDLINIKIHNCILGDLHFIVNSNITVKTLKQMILKQNQILNYPENFKISSNTKDLDDDTKTLKYYDVKDNDELSVYYDTIYIDIKLKGETHTIGCYKHYTVKQLKEVIIKYHPDMKIIRFYKLKLKDEILDETKKLSEYKIEDDTTLTTEIIKTKVNLRYNSKVYNYEVDNDTTIAQLETIFCNETIKSASHFNLYLNNHIMTSKTVIDDYDIKPDNVIECIAECIANDYIQVMIKDLSGRTLCIHIRNNDLIYNVLKLVEEKTEISIKDMRLIYAGKQLDFSNSESTVFKELGYLPNNPTFNLVLRLRGGKPVILFYPPKDTKELEVKTVLNLHSDCHYTTLLPKPIKEENRICWNGTVQNNVNSSDIVVNGRKHKYLFYEFENTGSEYVNSLIGVKSICDHLNETYIINGIDEYEDWCYKVLGKLGLKEKDIDDFMTFWAGNIQENGPYVIARIVPEVDIEKCCSLNVKITDKTSDVKINVRRVYVSMIVCDKIPEWIKTDETLDWKKEEIPEYFKPIEYYDDQLNVIEWGGIIMNL